MLVLPEHSHSRGIWTRSVFLPLPGGRGCLIRVPNLIGLHSYTTTRYGKRNGSFIMSMMYGSILLVLLWLYRYKPPDMSTLVFRPSDIQRICRWEIMSGHYPTEEPPPAELNLGAIVNPAHPPVGPKRTRLHVETKGTSTPRPLPGCIIDLDLLMEYCDLDRNMYVSDCLEVLRVGGGLNTGNHFQRKIPSRWMYTFVEDTSAPISPLDAAGYSTIQADGIPRIESNYDTTFEKSPIADWEASPISLPPIQAHLPSRNSPCDDDDPRIFHMYWTGEFTDKPYMAIMSFLFTQNLGLHLPDYEDERVFCRPRLWMWINPAPDMNTRGDMLEKLRMNPWSTAFFHPRFERVVQFKLWDTTEMLDSLPELKDDWRNVGTLLNSMGHVPHSTNGKKSPGSKKDYDEVSVVMSDMARFVLCHRFGGLYLDVDMLFLRDWEELWGWRGSFAYRWSYHPRHNTAVLRLRKGSALGTFLLRTALKNQLDFHPATVQRYLNDARLYNLLFRIPDALFDPAWLNFDKLQRERPPQPFFKAILDFFEPRAPGQAAPRALGFDGFFQGAYGYHYHNSWWVPMDPVQNYPVLGFNFTRKQGAFDSPEVVVQERVMSWSTVLKRTFEAYVRGEIPNMYGEWIWAESS